MDQFPIRDSYAYAIAAYRANWRLYAPLVLLTLLVSNCHELAGEAFKGTVTAGLFTIAVAIVSTLLWVAQMHASLKVYDGEPIAFGELFRFEGRHPVRAMLICVCYGFAVALAAIALVIPGLVVAARYLAAPFLAFERNLSLSAAWEDARALTTGVKGGVAFVGLFFIITIGLALVDAKLGNLSILVSLLGPVSCLAEVYVYRRLLARKAQSVA